MSHIVPLLERLAPPQTPCFPRGFALNFVEYESCIT